MKTIRMIVLFILSIGTACLAANDYRGLWVGQATLTHVNQATIPLNEENDPEPKDPNIPQPTSDAAHLRLILHVDGAGQVNLLKDVAILRRLDEADTNSVVATSEGDLTLVSDQRLYSDFPEQEAVRIASAVFDFGDFQTTRAVDAIVDAVVDVVMTNTTPAAESIATDAANGIIEDADVVAEFDDFIESVLVDSNLQAIADGSTPDPLQQQAAGMANTFYVDTRGVEALDAMADAANGETDPDAKQDAVRKVALRYADIGNAYQRFVLGDLFGDMIPAAAQAAASEAAATNATSDSISIAAHAVAEVRDAEDEAEDLWRQSGHDDTAPTNAVDRVLDAIIAAATTYTNTSALQLTIAQEAETAGWDEQATLPRFSIPATAPTTDYTNFIHSAAFQDCAATAARAALEAAVEEQDADPFHTPETLAAAARGGATDALKSVYIQAAQAQRTELPMAGTFAPGQGDTNLTINAGGSLGDPGLAGTISLPSSHPTNPFRHPKHPDHVRGFDIVRNIRLDFYGAEHQPGAKNSEVDRIAGLYREEIFGLHKPLGQQSDIGLKIEGTFELNRISLIDTLNAQ